MPNKELAGWSLTFPAVSILIGCATGALVCFLLRWRSLWSVVEPQTARFARVSCTALSHSTPRGGTCQHDVSARVSADVSFYCGWRRLARWKCPDKSRSPFTRVLRRCRQLPLLIVFFSRFLLALAAQQSKHPSHPALPSSSFLNPFTAEY